MHIKNEETTGFYLSFIVRAYISELNNIISEYYISEPPWGLIKQVFGIAGSFAFPSLFSYPQRKKKNLMTLFI